MNYATRRFFRNRRFAPLQLIAGWLVAAVLALAASAGHASAQDFTVTVSGMTDYTVNGQPDPTLSLIRGHTYTFALTTSGHPFYIKTAQVTGAASQFTTGVTNNGGTSGTLTFVVPASAPDQLFYQCSIHSAMTAAINISSAPVPAGGAGSAALLASLLLGAGWLCMLSLRRSASAL